MVIVGACGCLGLTGWLWLPVGVCGCLCLTGCTKYICALIIPGRYKILDTRYEVPGLGC